MTVYSIIFLNKAVDIKIIVYVRSENEKIAKSLINNLAEHDQFRDDFYPFFPSIKDIGIDEDVEEFEDVVEDYIIFSPEVLD